MQRRNIEVSLSYYVIVGQRYLLQDLASFL